MDGTIRRCAAADSPAILAIVNDAAQAYRGHIPADRWHEPYMPADELERELAAGVEFWGYEEAGRLAGVMGLQDVRDVALVRHAYVATLVRGRGIGGRLLAHLVRRATRPLLVGTWAAATWAQPGSAWSSSEQCRWNERSSAGKNRRRR